MANLLNFKETPNLLELIEAYHAKATPLGDLSICGDKVNGLPGSLIDLSLCADEGSDALGLTELSRCADEIPSVCADEAPEAPVGVRLKTDIEGVGATFSVCADEPSDVRLKTDIEQVGTTVYGLPLYHFRYKTGTERLEGVMAQDVLEVMPDAVVLGEDGYYRVKYGQLGIRMTRA